MDNITIPTMDSSSSNNNNKADLGEFRRPVFRRCEIRPRSGSSGPVSPSDENCRDGQVPTLPPETPTRARAKSSAPEFRSPQKANNTTNRQVKPFPQPPRGMIANGTNRQRQSVLLFGFDMDPQMMSDERPLIRFGDLAAPGAAFFAPQVWPGQVPQEWQPVNHAGWNSSTTIQAPSQWPDDSLWPRSNNVQETQHQNVDSVHPNPQVIMDNGERIQRQNGGKNHLPRPGYNGGLYTGGEMSRPHPVMSPARFNSHPVMSPARFNSHQNGRRNRQLHNRFDNNRTVRPAIPQHWHPISVQRPIKQHPGRRQEPPPMPAASPARNVAFEARDPPSQHQAPFGGSVMPHSHLSNAGSGARASPAGYYPPPPPPPVATEHIPQAVWDSAIMQFPQMTVRGVPPMRQGHRVDQEPRPTPVQQPQPTQHVRLAQQRLQTAGHGPTQQPPPGHLELVPAPGDYTESSVQSFAAAAQATQTDPSSSGPVRPDNTSKPAAKESGLFDSPKAVLKCSDGVSEYQDRVARVRLPYVFPLRTASPTKSGSGKSSLVTTNGKGAASAPFGTTGKAEKKKGNAAQAGSSTELNVASAPVPAPAPGSPISVDKTARQQCNGISNNDERLVAGAASQRPVHPSLAKTVSKGVAKNGQ
jgi:hypothetical protein